MALPRFIAQPFADYRLRNRLRKHGITKSVSDIHNIRTVSYSVDTSQITCRARRGKDNAKCMDSALDALVNDLELELKNPHQDISKLLEKIEVNGSIPSSLKARLYGNGKGLEIEQYDSVESFSQKISDYGLIRVSEEERKRLERSYPRLRGYFSRIPRPKLHNLTKPLAVVAGLIGMFFGGYHLSNLITPSMTSNAILADNLSVAGGAASAIFGGITIAKYYGRAPDILYAMRHPILSRYAKRADIYKALGEKMVLQPQTLAPK